MERKSIIQSIFDSNRKININLPTVDSLVSDPHYFHQGAIEEVHKIYQNKPVYWVVGHYKVGKSFLINQVFNDNIMNPHEHENTKGEIHYHHKQSRVITRDCVFIDTQGFDQILGNDDPEFDKDFIMSHMINMHSCIILVVPKYSYSQQTLIRELLSRAGFKIKKIIIVHNLKDYNTIQDLVNYRAQLIMKLKISEENMMMPIFGDMMLYLCERSKFSNTNIIHLMMGNKNKNLSRNCVEYLRHDVNGTPYESIHLIEAMVEIFKYLIIKYYTATSYSIYINVTIRCELEDYKKRNNNMELNQSKAIIEWSEGYVNSKKFVILEYTLPFFTLSHFRIMDEGNITLVGRIKSRYSQQDHIDQISTPYPIYQGQDESLQPKYLGQESSTIKISYFPTVTTNLMEIKVPLDSEKDLLQRDDLQYFAVILGPDASVIPKSKSFKHTYCGRYQKIEALFMKYRDALEIHRDFWERLILTYNTWEIVQGFSVSNNRYRIVIELIKTEFLLIEIRGKDEDEIPLPLIEPSSISILESFASRPMKSTNIFKVLFNQK